MDRSIRNSACLAISVASAVAWAASLSVAAPAQAALRPGGDVVVKLLSNRADLVSGGDALVEVILPPRVDPASAKIAVNGRDVAGQFESGRLKGLLSGVPPKNLLGIRSSANSIVGLVTGLATGPNVLRATLPDGYGAMITITGHPSGGPVFSGPQVQPWSCSTGAINMTCERAPTYTYFYMPAASSSAPDPGAVQSVSHDPRFQSYDPVSPPSPETIAQTTTDGGETVPFIVRVETGTINRGAYSISVLYDPSQSWSPWKPQVGWNHKLLFTGGSGCGLTYQDGAAPWSQAALALRRGFAVAFHELMNTGSNCNLAVEAESMMMTKEHIIEAYGPVRYTMGLGASGGAIVQQWISNAYPGLYDGLVAEGSFPDGWTNQWKTEDCISLVSYWSDPARWAAGVAWSPDDWSAVQDGDAAASCAGWDRGFRGLFTPADETGQVPPVEVYDPATNPDGVRGTLWDYSVAQLGRRPSSAWGPVEQKIGRGFANNPLDTVGVQYGLKALTDGRITAAQFADLNAKVGGHDIDFNPRPQRTQADLAGLAVVYRSGYLNQANNMHVPIVDVRGSDETGVHDIYHSWSMRARLVRANGHHNNQVIWVAPGGGGLPDQTDEPRAFALIDRWLSAIEADTSDTPLAQQVAANRPADAADKCTTGTGVAVPCVIPPSGSPRLGAGEPIADDIAKCQLKDLRRTDYNVSFTEVQWSQLQEAFPAGVCDYTKSGVNQQPTVPWLTYEDGPKGRALGAAPVSAPFGPKAALLGLPRNRRCISRRVFIIRLRARDGQRLVRANVTVAGKPAKVRRRGGRLVARVDLRHLSKGRFTVKVTATTAQGHRLHEARRYRTCARK